MNIKLFSLIVGFVLLLATGVLAAEEVGNKICPVSGEKVGEMGEVVKYEYKGKIYNLCCKMCIKDFKKDPEKFSQKAEEEANTTSSSHEHGGHDHNK